MFAIHAPMLICFRFEYHYSKSALDEATSLVKDGELGLNDAAVKYCIPRSTIDSRLRKDGYYSKEKIVPDPILSPLIKSEIGAWVKKMLEIGCTNTTEALPYIVRDMCETFGEHTMFPVSNLPALKYCLKFTEENNIKVNLPINDNAPLSNVAINWFESFQTYLEASFGLDAASFLNGNHEQVYCCYCVADVIKNEDSLHAKLVNKASGFDHESQRIMSLYSCLGSSGKVLKPFVTLKHRGAEQKTIDCSSSSLFIMRSREGKIDGDALFDWLQLMVASLDAEKVSKPFLFLLDQSIHPISPAALQYCQANLIILFYLPCIKINLSLPFGWGIFTKLHKTFALCTPKGRKSAMSKTEALELLARCWGKAVDACDAKREFKTFGIVPLSIRDLETCMKTMLSEICGKEELSKNVVLSADKEEKVTSSDNQKNTKSIPASTHCQADVKCSNELASGDEYPLGRRLSRRVPFKGKMAQMARSKAIKRRTKSSAPLADHPKATHFNASNPKDALFGSSLKNGKSAATALQKSSDGADKRRPRASSREKSLPSTGGTPANIPPPRRRSIILKDGQWILVNGSEAAEEKTSAKPPIKCSSCCQKVQDGHQEGIKQGMMLALRNIELLLPADLLKLYNQRYEKLLQTNSAQEKDSKKVNEKAVTQKGKENTRSTNLVQEPLKGDLSPKINVEPAYVMWLSLKRSIDSDPYKLIANASSCAGCCSEATTASLPNASLANASLPSDVVEKRKVLVCYLQENKPLRPSASNSEHPPQDYAKQQAWSNPTPSTAADACNAEATQTSYLPSSQAAKPHAVQSVFSNITNNNINNNITNNNIINNDNKAKLVSFSSAFGNQLQGRYNAGSFNNFVDLGDGCHGNQSCQMMAAPLPTDSKCLTANKAPLLFAGGFPSSLPPAFVPQTNHPFSSSSEPIISRQPMMYDGHSMQTPLMEMPGALFPNFSNFSAPAGGELNAPLVAAKSLPQQNFGVPQPHQATGPPPPPVYAPEGAKFEAFPHGFVMNGMQQAAHLPPLLPANPLRPGDPFGALDAFERPLQNLLPRTMEDGPKQAADIIPTSHALTSAPNALASAPSHVLASAPSHVLASAPSHALPSAPNALASAPNALASAPNALASAPSHTLASAPNALAIAPSHALASAPSHALASAPSHALPSAPNALASAPNALASAPSHALASAPNALASAPSEVLGSPTLPANEAASAHSKDSMQSALPANSAPCPVPVADPMAVPSHEDPSPAGEETFQRPEEGQIAVAV